MRAEKLPVLEISDPDQSVLQEIATDQRPRHTMSEQTLSEKGIFSTDASYRGSRSP